MQNPNTNILKVRSNNPVIFTIILIILFIISVSYMAFYDIGLFKNHKNLSQLPATVNQEGAANLQLIKLDANNPAPLLENFQSPQTSQAMVTSNNLAKIGSNIEKSDNLPRDSYALFNDYRNYLLNINLLILNFLQDKIYTEQLYKIELQDFPHEIKNIIGDLLNYNENYLLNTKIDKIFPPNSSHSSWLEKFIKIEKRPYNEGKVVLKERIIKNLELFLNFFYSFKFQQKFVEGNND